MEQRIKRIGGEFRVNTYVDNSQWGSSVGFFNDGSYVIAWNSLGQDGSGYGIYSQRYSADSGKINGEFIVNKYTIGDQKNPVIATFSNKNFIIVWVSNSQDGSGFGIYGQKYDADGNKIGSEFLINKYTTSHQLQPSIASFKDNSFIVVWASLGQDGSGFGVYAQLYDHELNKSSQEFLVNTQTYGNQFNPAVSAFDDGRFIIAWAGNDGSAEGVFAQVYDKIGRKLGGEFQVNSYTDSSQYNPSIGVFLDGTFVIVWNSNGQDGSAYGIYGKRYDKNLNLLDNGEFKINTYSDSWQVNPKILTFVDNSYVVVWASYWQDGSDYGIYGILYNNNNYEVGGEFLVNTQTAGKQGYVYNGGDYTEWHGGPKIGGLKDGKFIVIWESTQLGGLDVFAQRFNYSIDPIVNTSPITQTPSYSSSFTSAITQTPSYSSSFTSAITQTPSYSSSFTSSFAVQSHREYNSLTPTSTPSLTNMPQHMIVNQCKVSAETCINDFSNAVINAPITISQNCKSSIICLYNSSKGNVVVTPNVQKYEIYGFDSDKNALDITGFNCFDKSFEKVCDNNHICSTGFSFVKQGTKEISEIIFSNTIGKIGASNFIGNAINQGCEESPPISNSITIEPAIALLGISCLIALELLW